MDASQLSSAFLIITLWAMGLGLGMQFSLPQIVAPLKHVRLITIAILVNVVAVPLVAWGATAVLPIDDAYASGVLLTSFAMAAPAGLKFTQIARGDMPFAVSLVVLLSALNVLTIPAWSALLLSGDVTVPIGSILLTLLITVILPLGMGLFIRARWPEHPNNWSPDLAKLSNLTLAIAIVLNVIAYWSSLLSLVGSLSIIAGLVIAPAAFALGYLSGSDGPSRRSASIVSSCRAIGPALLIATTTFASEPKVIAGVIAAGIATALVGPVAALEWGRRGGTEKEPSQATAIGSQSHAPTA